MKIVLDTNIFISGIITPKGKAGKILNEYKNNALEIITSHELLQEVKKVLNYPKIIKIIKWDQKKIDEFIEYLYFFTSIVDITGIDYHFDQDPNDNHIIATYLAANCDYLVTGDKALLSLNGEFNVITLEEFITKHCLYH